MHLKCKFIAPDGPDYEVERLLRWEVLHKPLGMPPGSEALSEELVSLHLIGSIKKEIVGCICFFPEDLKTGRVYQMAIGEEHQGKGYGKQILHFLENTLQERGFKRIYLISGLDTQKFYEKLGYLPEADIVEQRGLNYRRMTKQL